MEPIAKRPRSITVIAWSSILTGGFLVLGAFFGFVALKLLILRLGQEGIMQLYNSSTIFSNIGISPLVFFILLGVLQLGVGIFFLVAGIQFLKLRAWARTALEISTWLGLIYGVISGLWGIYEWTSMDPTTVFGKGIPIDAYALKRFGVIASVVGMAVWTILSIVIIKLLRGETIRNAVSHN